MTKRIFSALLILSVLSVVVGKGMESICNDCEDTYESQSTSHQDNSATEDDHNDCSDKDGSCQQCLFCHFSVTLNQSNIFVNPELISSSLLYKHLFFSNYTPNTPKEPPRGLLS